MYKRFIIFFLFVPFLPVNAQLRHDIRNAASLATVQDEQQMEEDEIPPGRGLTFALNLGMVFPSNYTANFYNGSDQNPNKVSRIVLNKYYKAEIVQLIGHEYDSSGIELPGNMAYKVAMNVGFFARYSPNARNGFFLQFNYHKLTTNDIFLIHWKLDYPTNQESYTTSYIYGEEERNNIDLGYIREFPLSEIINLYMETGINISNTKVLKNLIEIEGREFNIQYTGEHPLGPYSTNLSYDFRQGGIGFGAFFGTGVRLIFNEKISIDPGINFYWKKINLEGYEAFKPEFTAMVRLTIKNPFW